MNRPPMSDSGPQFLGKMLANRHSQGKTSGKSPRQSLISDAEGVSPAEPLRILSSTGPLHVPYEGGNPEQESTSSDCILPHSVQDRSATGHEEVPPRQSPAAVFPGSDNGRTRIRSGFPMCPQWYETARGARSAKKIPEAANPRGAEDSSYFRGRLARLSARMKFFSALAPDGTNSTTIAKTGQYVSAAKSCS